MLPQLLGDDWNNPNSPYIKKHETEATIRFKKSGGMLYLVGSDRPDLMRGPNPHGVIIDEASVQKPEVWSDIIQPIMLANPDSWCWFLSTPHGKNHFWEFYQRGQNEEFKDWHSSELKATESGIFNEETLLEAKAQMTDAAYRQELMCEFLEGEGTVFRHVRYVCTERTQDPVPGHLYIAGVDLAKQQDWTVVAVYDRATNKQVYQDRWQTLEWPYQVKRIRAITGKYNRALAVVDATGVGDPIADSLTREGVSVLPFKITSQSKKDLVEKLVIWIEQKKLRMIQDDQTLFELENFGYEVSRQGHVSYSAPQGMHDDIVIAHALAVSELHELFVQTPPEDMTPVQRHYWELKQQRSGDNITDMQEWGSD